MPSVLYAASEAVPFAKTGGLADVAASLPKELRRSGLDIRVVIPRYKEIPESFKNQMVTLKETSVAVGWRKQYCGIQYLEYEGVPYYFIENEYYFYRDGLYGFYDDGERFAFFDQAVLKMIGQLDFKPDIIHCNDWHTGMIIPLLHERFKGRPGYENIKTIFTIHNLKYQGIFPPEALELFSLDPSYLYSGRLEFHGCMSFLKAGIIHSDAITTVSGCYAGEIQDPYFGERLDGVLRERSKDLHGITNGIDYDIYDPSRDPEIFSNYTLDSLENKLVNKQKLQEMLGFPQEAATPLIGMVTRIDNMKGFDLLFHVMEEIMSLDLQMVILGTGDPGFEALLKDYARRYGDKFSAQIKFSFSLAQKIYAACDMLLMPSMFEPCGLSQLIALRYGTIPIVRETGGLKDTVTCYDELTGQGNGFSFYNYNAHEMLFTLKKAIELFKDRVSWKKIITNAMNGEYSWNRAANSYKELYGEICRKGMADTAHEGED